MAPRTPRQDTAAPTPPQRAEVPRCERCHIPMGTPGRKGRPRRFCSHACRQRAYEQRTVQRMESSAEELIRELRGRLDLHTDQLHELRDLTRELVELLDAYELVETDPAVMRVLKLLEPMLDPPSGHDPGKTPEIHVM